MQIRYSTQNNTYRNDLISRYLKMSIVCEIAQRCFLATQVFYVPFLYLLSLFLQLSDSLLHFPKNYIKNPNRFSAQKNSGFKRFCNKKIF